MTNLSPQLPSWRRRITRERVLVGVPLAVGCLVAILLVFTLIMPSMKRLDAQEKRQELLLRQQALLPLLPSKLKKSTEQLARVQQQQDLLINLIAGKDKIQTFLAQLSREAISAGVVLERYEPSSVAPSRPTKTNKKSSTKNSKEDGKEISSETLLKALGYEKTSVLLQARGPFVALQSFLRGIEALQLVVQASDLEFIALDPQKGQDELSQGPALTQLKLRLTFYDKMLAPEKSEVVEDS